MFAILTKPWVDERLRLRNPHGHHFISILCSANDVE